jgi:hypothetical protein
MRQQRYPAPQRQLFGTRSNEMYTTAYEHMVYGQLGQSVLSPVTITRCGAAWVVFDSFLVLLGNMNSSSETERPSLGWSFLHKPAEQEFIHIQLT